MVGCDSRRSGFAGVSEADGGGLGGAGGNVEEVWGTASLAEARILSPNSAVLGDT